MRSKLEQKIRRNRYLPRFLVELSALTNTSIRESDLNSIANTEALKKSAEYWNSLPKRKFEISFKEKSSVKFRRYIAELQRLNRSRVCLWIDAVLDCGVLQLDSLDMINFQFKFTDIHGGIVAITTEDHREKLILDFDEILEEERFLEVEVIGDNWATLDYQSFEV